MNYSQVFWGIFCAFFLSACAATPLSPPDFFYDKEAIEVHIQADPLLNLDQGSPHTLLICVHQLKDPNAFNRLIVDTDGIYKLLECSQFDDSVTHSKRIIVQPDQKVSYIVDRAEGTKFVAVGAGYYNVKKDDVVRLYEIPVVTKSLGFLGRTQVAEPGVLQIKLDLGPVKIRRAVDSSDRTRAADPEVQTRVVDPEVQTRVVVPEVRTRVVKPALKLDFDLGPLKVRSGVE